MTRCFDRTSEYFFSRHIDKLDFIANKSTKTRNHYFINKKKIDTSTSVEGILIQYVLIKRHGVNSFSVIRYVQISKNHFNDRSFEMLTRMFSLFSYNIRIKIFLQFFFTKSQKIGKRTKLSEKKLQTILLKLNLTTAKTIKTT